MEVKSTTIAVADQNTSRIVADCECEELHFRRALPLAPVVVFSQNTVMAGTRYPVNPSENGDLTEAVRVFK